MAVQLHSSADQLPIQSENPPNLSSPICFAHTSASTGLRTRVLLPQRGFEQAEAESSLYARFLALTSKFDLVPAELLVILSNQYNGKGEKVHARDAHEHYPPPSQPIARTNLLSKVQQQHQPGLLKARSPLAPSPSDSDSPSTTNGGIGEHPTIGHGSRSRFGRNRTDTMVFADIEYS